MACIGCHEDRMLAPPSAGIIPFIDMLSEIGVDVLDPIQVSAVNMDPAQIKGEYGSRICLHGSIDTPAKSRDRPN